MVKPETMKKSPKSQNIIQLIIAFTMIRQFKWSRLLTFKEKWNHYFHLFYGNVFKTLIDRLTWTIYLQTKYLILTGRFVNVQIYDMSHYN